MSIFSTSHCLHIHTSYGDLSVTHSHLRDEEEEEERLFKQLLMFSIISVYASAAIGKEKERLVSRQPEDK